MPAVPIDSLALLDPLSAVLLASCLGLVAWERLAGGRPLPLVRGWELRAAAVLAAYVQLSPYLPPRWGHVLAALRWEAAVITLAL